MVLNNTANGNMLRSPSFIDLFAGSGGLSLGLIRSGWRLKFALESDKFAFQTFKYNILDSAIGNEGVSWPDWLEARPQCANRFLNYFGDSLSSLCEDLDLIAGGPPCQGFSSAGRRFSEDPRNSLVDTYIDIVRKIRPKALIVENVRGFDFDFNKGPISNYATHLQQALSDEYKMFADTINVAAFGVPQNRKRFFMIAIRNDITVTDNPFELLEREATAFLGARTLCPFPTAGSAISDLEVARNGTRPSGSDKRYMEIDYKGPQTDYQRYLHANTGDAIADLRLARHTEEIRLRFARIIDECNKQGRLNRSLTREMREYYGLKKHAIRVLDPNQPAPTITSMPDDLLHYREPRTLTVRENARLQGFPDWFHFQGKYTSGGDRRRNEVPRFTQVANAVPPLIAELLGQCMRELIKA